MAGRPAVDGLFLRRLAHVSVKRTRNSGKHTRARTISARWRYHARPSCVSATSVCVRFSSVHPRRPMHQLCSQQGSSVRQFGCLLDGGNESLRLCAGLGWGYMWAMDTNTHQGKMKPGKTTPGYIYQSCCIELEKIYFIASPCE